MCGILGGINARVTKEHLDLLGHRGPDGHGLIHVNIDEHLLSLGHTRLAIVDLSSSGSQPMATPNKDHYLVYNGEVYNHQEIRKELRDIEFLGHSDTETVLHAIARYGLEAVRQFNGIFALAFADLPKQKLYLVRDRFGIKPLYYAISPKFFCFSSEIKPLLRLSGGQLDNKYLAELLKMRYSPSPDTLFNNIKKLRPGHVLEVDFGGNELKQKEYSILQNAVSYSSISFNEALDQYGVLFEKAIKRQMMSDVEVGVLLSGGVDSALVSQHVSKNSGGKVKAFTVGYNEDKDNVDEIADAGETANRLGLEHHIVRISYDDFIESIRQCVSIIEEPLATTSTVPMYHLSKMAAQYVKVVLSGQGADEYLGGYDRYQGELCRRFVPSQIVQLANKFATKCGMKNEQVRRGLNALSEQDDILRFQESYAVFNDDEIMRLIGSNDNLSSGRIRYFYDLLDSGSRAHAVERMMSLDLRLNLADDLLLYTDKVTMHHSLECRVPMLDFELVRFVESLPYKYRVRIGRKKIIHKRFAEKTIPESVIRRRRKGFFSPTKSWFRKSNIVREILLDPASKFANRFDLSLINELIKAHEEGYNKERQLFLLLCLYYWMEEFS